MLCALFVYRYEIAEMEKIPTTLPNFDDVMKAFTADLPLVREHPCFPALSTYQYSKTKMREDLDYTGRTESLAQDTDVSKHKMEEHSLFESIILFWGLLFYTVMTK
jgi:hypothetical protein